MTYRYQEEIAFHPVVKIAYFAMLLTLVVFALGERDHSGSLLVFLPLAVILVAIPLLFGRLVFEVQEESIRIRFGYVGWPGRIVPLGDVERTEVVTYRPIRQFGGWGIRGGRFQGEFTGVYSMRGNRGLLLFLTQDTRVFLFRTRRLLVGSQEPERLQQAIDR
jgi:hypothetical protein